MAELPRQSSVPVMSSMPGRWWRYDADQESYFLAIRTERGIDIQIGGSPHPTLQARTGDIQEEPAWSVTLPPNAAADFRRWVTT